MLCYLGNTNKMCVFSMAFFFFVIFILLLVESMQFEESTDKEGLPVLK